MSVAVAYLMLGKINQLTIRKNHIQLEKTPFPNRVLLARNAAFPALHFENTLRGAAGLRNETEHRITTPLPSMRMSDRLCSTS